jgi:hypothetical protein
MQHLARIVRVSFFISVLVLLFSLTSTQTHAQTAASPTLFCLGNTTCSDALSPTVSVAPSSGVEPSTTDVPQESLSPSTGDITTEPNEGEISTEPSTTIEPCESTESTVSVQHRGRHHGHHHRKHSMSDFLKWLIELINKLIEKLGGQPIDVPTDPCITPEPTQGEEEPTTEPTENDISTEPSQGEEEPSTAPTAGEEEPSTAPSTGPTGTGGAGTSATVNITFYGTYDNDPKGSMNIAHPVIHQQVGGVGTYADPLTFASPAGDGAYEYGQIIYVPKVQKYFIKEDECAVSWTAEDGCGAVTMVDLYVGNPSDEKVVVECENSLTDGEGEIILDPPSNLTVSPEKIWDQATGTCMQLKN